MSKSKKARASTSASADITPIYAPNELNPFVRQSLQVSVQQTNVYEYLPIQEFNRNSAIEFSIKANGLEWVNLNSLRLRISVKLVNGDRTELDPAFNTGPVAYFGTSMFRDVSIRLGMGTVVSSENGLYHYKCFIQNEYLQPRFVLLQEQYSNYNFRDRYTAMDDFDRGPDEGPWVNPGFGRRAELAANSKLMFLYAHLHTETTLQQKFLPSTMDFAVKLRLNEDSFVIKTNAPAAQRDMIFLIDYISLFVEKCVLNPTLDMQLLTKIEKEGMIMSVDAVDMVQITKPTGIRTFKEPLLLNRPLPQKVFLIQVSADRANGSYTMNGFKTRFINYDEVSLSSGNLVFPNSRPFKIAAESRDCLRAYEEMLHCTGSKDNANGRSNMITYEEFLSTRGILCFDLGRLHTAGGAQANDVPRIGNLYLNVKLDRDTETAVNFIAYLSRPGTIYFRSNLEVQLDYF